MVNDALRLPNPGCARPGVEPLRELNFRRANSAQLPCSQVRIAAAMPRTSAKSSAAAASPAELERLEEAIAELKALTVASMLRQGLQALRADDAKGGSEWALKALGQDPRSGMAWYVLAVAREKAGDFIHSMKAYEAALELLPDEAEVANGLGRLAFKMGM